MPLLGAHGWIGMQVVDAEGVELGYVSAEDDRFLAIAEGPAGKLMLSRRYVANASDRVVLQGASREMFTNLNVVDSLGEFVGIVRDTMEAVNVLDGLILEDEGGEMITVLLEDIRAIDEWVDLELTAEDLYEKQGG